MAKGSRDKDIARDIVMAQIASDGGKNIRESRRYLPRAFTTWRGGYRSKDYHILRAIMGILRSRDSQFRFCVTQDGDEEDTYIVYFEFVAFDGTKKQISFHSFREAVGKFASAKVRMAWDKKSSRATARYLAENLSAF